MCTAYAQTVCAVIVVLRRVTAIASWTDIICDYSLMRSLVRRVQKKRKRRRLQNEASQKTAMIHCVYTKSTVHAYAVQLLRPTVTRARQGLPCVLRRMLVVVRLLVFRLGLTSLKNQAKNLVDREPSVRCLFLGIQTLAILCTLPEHSALDSRLLVALIARDCPACNVFIQ